MTSVESPPMTEPAVTLSAKSQEEFKRAVNTLGVKYNIMYHPDVPKRGRIYEGDDWSELSGDNDNPVRRAMWPQLHPWIRNQRGWQGEPEAVWNPHWVPVVGLNRNTDTGRYIGQRYQLTDRPSGIARHR